MNISLNWLRQYIDLSDFDPNTIEEVLTSIGLEVEGMEERESIPGGLKGIVVGEVLTCGKHPGADRLSLTTVNIGAEAPLQIVCGAPNVAAGQKVLVATIGAKLHPVEGEPFAIKKGKIRGEASEGMICAEDEIGVGSSHDGIMVLPAEIKAGTKAADYFELETDVIYEIGLTPNRADANSHIGVARDLAAALRINKSSESILNLPKVSIETPANAAPPLNIKIENTTACPRYSGISISGIKVGESPAWLKQRLLSIGSRPINNIVDITNYVLHETGQPLHAFDNDKIKGNGIIVKNLAKDTPFVTLDEIERKLHEEDLMICDGEGNPMCIAGVFGGVGSGVTDTTTDIFLESAYFNAKTIRKTSMRHLLRTDAATHFEKGADPNGTIYALQRAAQMICELAGGTISSTTFDFYPQPIEAKPIEVRFQKVEDLIGCPIPKAKIKAIFEALNIKVLNETDQALTIKVPTDKPDVIREVDVIEEILRIYGFNEVSIDHKLKSAISLSAKPDVNRLKELVSQYLAGNGFFEMMGLSLTQSKYCEEVFPIAKESLVYVHNTSNIHLDIMRPTMIFNGLEAVLHNQNRQQADVRLFEFGKSYLRGEGEDFQEESHLTLFLSGRAHSESWHAKGGNESFYSLKAYVDGLFARLGLSGYQTSPAEESAELDYGLSYHRGPKVLANFGLLNTGVSKQMGIRNEVYYADFKWSSILEALKKHKIDYQSITKFPSMRRDLALVIEKSVKFQDIETLAKKTGKKLLSDINLFDVYENEEQLGAGKKSYAISLIFEDQQKTLKDKEVDQLMKKLIHEYESKLGALIRR